MKKKKRIVEFPLSGKTVRELCQSKLKVKDIKKLMKGGK